MSKKRILWHLVICWGTLFGITLLVWSSVSSAQKGILDFQFLVYGVITFCMAVIFVLIGNRSVNTRNRLDDLERQNEILTEALKKPLLTTEGYGKIVFDNLAACVEILSNQSNEILVARTNNDVTVCLPSAMTCIIRSSKIFMDMDVDFETCQDEDITATMTLKVLYEILDRQEYFARIATNRIYCFGDEIASSQRQFAQGVCGEEYLEKDTFRLYLNGKINLPDGIMTDTDVDGREYVIGTVADFVCWIAENNLKENSEGE